MSSVGVKRCCRCKESKRSEDFGRNRSNKDGLADYCRECARIKDRLRYQKDREKRLIQSRAEYQRNRDKKLAQKREYRERTGGQDPAYYARYYRENVERQRPIRDAWIAANREKLAQKRRAYRAAHREQINARIDKWKRLNRERVREHLRLAKARRRARKLSQPVFTLTKKDEQRLLSSPCAVPGCTNRDIHLDHVIPIARGGSHGVGNLQPLCAHHNYRKGSKTWMEFRVYLRSE